MNGLMDMFANLFKPDADGKSALGGIINSVIGAMSGGAKSRR